MAALGMPDRQTEKRPEDSTPVSKPWRWRERAVQWLQFPLGRFLDFGCGRCGLLERVRHRCSECHGVDVDPVVLEDARRRHPDFQLITIGQEERTIYPDHHFDTIAVVEVIEHVTDERATLREIARILRPGGKIVLTTPHAGWLTFLDLGNFKFVFPGIHRWIHLYVLRQRDYYEHRFRRAPQRGLIGDISLSDRRAPWHRHYKPEEIKALFPPDIILRRYEVYFPGMRAFMLLRAVIHVLTVGLVRKLPWPLSALEIRLSRIVSRAGDQLVMLFEKKGEPS